MYATCPSHKNLALFDFDGTLCTKDSFTGFIFYALKKRHIVKQGIKILPWIQAYYLNIYPAHAMRPKLFKAMFGDMPSQQILDLALEYSHQLRNQLSSELYQQLLMHQHNEDDVVIVSASLDIYLKDIADLLNVDLICTQVEIKDQHFSGEFFTPDCSSEQKKQRILAQYDLSQYQEVYAYGNSKEDLDMMSLADHRYMVGETKQLPHIKRQKKFA